MANYKMITKFTQFGANDKQIFRCNAVVFKNSGDRVAIINDTWRLDPGDETPTISTGHPDVVDLTEYTIAFDATSGGTAPLVNVIYTQTTPIKTKGSGVANCENF
jgi:hypothetical protein